ncbi:MAG: hypothetical protein SF053_06320 [Bacteroidia bacterium]|nr:hypothetical protein [Bacteroidia bacterium]
MQLHHWADITGAAGVSLILLAYFCSLSGRWQQDSPVYLIVNLAGAALACLSSILLGSLPFTILEATWAIVSLLALIRTLSRGRP